MAKVKFDGVVEAVHYASDGVVGWVRVYERRGPTFSDRLILDRQTLLERLQAGKKFVVGERVELLASTFNVTQALRLVKDNGDEYVVSGDVETANKDHLKGVPLI